MLHVTGGSCSSRSQVSKPVSSSAAERLTSQYQDCMYDDLKILFFTFLDTAGLLGLSSGLPSRCAVAKLREQDRLQKRLDLE